MKGSVQDLDCKLSCTRFCGESLFVNYNIQVSGYYMVKIAVHCVGLRDSYSTCACSQTKLIGRGTNV